MVLRLAMLRDPAACCAILLAVEGLHDLEQLCYGWRLEGDVSWESGCRVQPGGHAVLCHAVPCCAMPGCAALCRAGHHVLLLCLKADARTLGAAGRALAFCKHLEFMPCSPLSPGLHPAIPPCPADLLLVDPCNPALRYFPADEASERAPLPLPTVTLPDGTRAAVASTLEGLAQELARQRQLAASGPAAAGERWAVER